MFNSLILELRSSPYLALALTLTLTQGLALVLALVLALILALILAHVLVLVLALIELVEHTSEVIHNSLASTPCTSRLDLQKRSIVLQYK